MPRGCSEVTIIVLAITVKGFLLIDIHIFGIVIRIVPLVGLFIVLFDSLKF